MSSQPISNPAHPAWRRFVVLGLLVCLAAGLRSFQLGSQELRGDEAFDALFSAQPVDVILTELQEEQPYPPLFHVGLHYWLDVLGQSEVVQRLPAMLAGVLLVPLVYLLARTLLTETTALIAAGLAAVNPFYIWHSQDGRMYSLLAVLCLGSMWLALRLLQNSRDWRVGAAYCAVTFLALFTHYFAWPVLLAENLAAGLYILRREQRRLEVRRWLLWQGAVILPQIPWLMFASGLLTSHTSNWVQPVGPLQMLERAMVTFSLGSTAQPSAAIPASLLMVSLFVAGSLFRRENSEARGNGRAFLLLFIATPLLATLLVSLRRPAFDEKYLIAVVAPFLIIVAHGLHFLLKRLRPLGIVASLAILLAAGWSLGNYYFDPDYAKSPRWRDVVAGISTNETDGDLIVYDYPDPGLQYYYRGDLPLRLLPDSSTSGQEQTDRTLEELAANYSRVWLVSARPSAWDPQGWVGKWLARYGDLVDERAMGSLTLQLYHTPGTYLEDMQPVHIRVGDQVELLGFRLAPAAGEPHAPGDPLVLTLYWGALQPLDADYKVFVHLSDANERIWAQHDGQPVNGAYPTAGWLPGEIVVDRHALQLDDGAPVGRYRLLVGMYDSATAQRLAVAGPADTVTDDRIVLSILEVTGSPESVE